MDSAHGRLLSQAIDASDSPTYITNRDWRIIYINDGFIRAFGYRMEDAVGKMPSELLAPDTQMEEIARYQAQFKRGESFKGDRLLSLANGGRLWATVSDTPVLDEKGRMVNVIGVLTDITRAKLHETLQQKILEAMIGDITLDAVMTMLCREVDRINPGTLSSVMRIDDLGIMHPLAGPGFPPEYLHAMEGVSIGPQSGSCGTAAFRGVPVIVTDIASDPLWATCREHALVLGLRACWSVPIKNGAGKVIATFAFYYHECRGPSALDERLVEVCTHLCTLAIERDASFRRIQQLAYYDGLTGLPNRALLTIQAQQAIERVAQTGDLLAVLHIDLDRFKRVNDTFGHAQGDNVLCMTAQRLCSHLLAGDIASRVAGDEFVLVLIRQNQRQLDDFLSQIDLQLHQTYSVGGVLMNSPASIGISLYPADGADIETLLQYADMAMYQAKKQKTGGRICFYSEKINLRLRERVELEEALRRALLGNQLQLAFQPQIRLDDGSLFGVEALARWQHPVWGAVPPVRFIALAEECGLIHKISRWVLQEACRQLKRWRQQGFSVPSISINLSPMDFHIQALPSIIDDELRLHQLSSQDLIIEITESILIDADPISLNNLLSVHKRGIRLAMDDFGTGYSSLSYLRHLPFWELKLDKSFVDELETNESSRALSKAVVSIGSNLNLTLVAEGVENKAQYQILREQGYHAIQGYLFSRPMSASAFTEWLRHRIHVALE
ncbi:bifunctional diguanylate cyclase/phosphodiesterase [Affinibrenneria salicis]|nr:EAL domain-containing protein [Affinibrenneria salicis]